ncbi:unnamed protein product [Mortierella alpina]
MAIAIPLVILVILPKIVQSIVNGSTMTLAQMNMTHATETSTQVSLAGAVRNAGIFSATIDFPEPIAVAWEGRSLGTVNMSSIKATGGEGTIFEKTHMSVDSFVWTMTSVVNVRAIGRTIRDIKTVKQIRMLGMNGFTNISIDSFDLPGDAPNNSGAYVRLVTSMNNPSPIGLDLGTIAFDLFFNDTYLGQVESKNAVLVGDSASTLTLEGTLIRHTNQTDLDKVSVLMSNYLAGNSSMTIGNGVFVKPDGVNQVSWLTNGLLAMTLKVPLKPPSPLNIITDINIKDMGMVFDPAKPYQPLTSSNLLTAAFKLPFNITTSMKNHSRSAGAISDTPFGVLKLTGIPFESNVTLKGIEFNSIKAAVSNVVTSSGTSDHIVLTERLAVPNSSSLSFSSGSATLTVYDKESNEYLGELFFPAMKLVPGLNSISTQFLFRPTNPTVRDGFVAKYLVGGESLLKAMGTKVSTQSVELQQAFSLIALASTAPGMNPPPRLILSGTAKSNLNTVFGNRQTVAQIRMVNPMDTDLYVTGLEAQLVPPKAVAQTPEMIIQHPQGFDFAGYMVTKLLPQYPKIITSGENIPFDLQSVMSVRVGGANGYAASIQYSQQQSIFVTMSIF